MNNTSKSNSNLEPVIAIQNLTKYYGKARGIIDVSFDVMPGEIFGFIGPNGAGKSTTIRTLLGLIYPTSGSAQLFGQDAIKEGHKLRRHVGYLPSEVFYYDHMKVIDLLKYSASFYGSVDMPRIKMLAETLDLDLSRKIDDLSFGNKKKVGIVQGLLHRPKLIVLDEPTSGLDPLMQQKFFALLAKENEAGATVLMSSHILSEVQKLCSRVAIIKEGRILRIEDIATLRATAYKKVAIQPKDTINMADVKQLPDGTTHIQILGNLQGISNTHVSALGEVSFLYKGEINALLSQLSHLQLDNAIIEEPDLEEIFLHYYTKEV